MTAALSPQEQKLFALIGKGVASVDTLYRHIVGADGSDGRLMQQRIGSIVARYNAKRPARKIVKGAKKRTYQFKRAR